MFAGACGDLVKLACEQMCYTDVNQLPVLGCVFGLCGSSCELLSFPTRAVIFLLLWYKHLKKISKRA